MAKAPVILLPPSEGKAPGGDGPPWAPGDAVLPALDESRLTVLRAADDAGMGVLDAPTLPARERFTGVLYRELDLPSLPAAARRRLAGQVLVFNGLLGVVGLGDPVPDHRLKMSASLPGPGRLARFWRPRLTEALAPRLAGRVVWDLLPQEHAAAWDPAQVAWRRRITVRFLTADGATVSHWNKLLKGAVVRHIALTGLQDPEGLGELVHPVGYRFDPVSSQLEGPTAEVVLRAR